MYRTLQMEWAQLLLSTLHITMALLITKPLTQESVYRTLKMKWARLFLSPLKISMVLMDLEFLCQEPVPRFWVPPPLDRRPFAAFLRVFTTLPRTSPRTLQWRALPGTLHRPKLLVLVQPILHR